LGAPTTATSPAFNQAFLCVKAASVSILPKHPERLKRRGAPPMANSSPQAGKTLLRSFAAARRIRHSVLLRRDRIHRLRTATTSTKKLHAGRLLAYLIGTNNIDHAPHADLPPSLQRWQQSRRSLRHDTQLYEAERCPASSADDPTGQTLWSVWQISAIRQSRARACTVINSKSIKLRRKGQEFRREVPQAVKAHRVSGWSGQGDGATRRSAFESSALKGRSRNVKKRLLSSLCVGVDRCGYTLLS